MRSVDDRLNQHFPIQFPTDVGRKNNNWVQNDCIQHPQVQVFMDASKRGNDTGFVFLASREDVAPQHHNTTNSKEGTKAIDAGAGTRRGGAKKCFNCWRLATSSTSARRGRVPHQTLASRRQGATKVPCQMSALRHPPAAGPRSRYRQRSTRGWGHRGGAVSLAARPRPPSGPPQRGARGQGTPRRRRALLPHTSRRPEAPGSPTPRRWRAASEWC